MYLVRVGIWLFILKTNRPAKISSLIVLHNKNNINLIKQSKFVLNIHIILPNYKIYQNKVICFDIKVSCGLLRLGPKISILGPSLR